MLWPDDEFDRELIAHVRPEDWVNPAPRERYDLVVIGAGTAGLVTAAGAAGLGARVALVEKNLMGGDCLNYGCVPSKAILHAARVASAAGIDDPESGIRRSPAEIDFARVMRQVRRSRASIAPHDSAARFTQLGVDVFLGAARFVGNKVVHVDGHDQRESLLTFKKAVVATGTRAHIPDIPGLDGVPFLTNETLFSLGELPKRLGIIGGGPIGVEMAQAFARLGSEVTLFQRSTSILTRDDPDASAIVQQSLKRDGVRIFTGARDLSVDTGGTEVRIQSTDSESVAVDRLLVATGRRANVEEIGLENVGVECDELGIRVDDFLATTNRNIFAAGDVCSLYKFTHAADFMARCVIQNALFAIGPIGRRRVSKLVIPRSTYTFPEVAHTGISIDEAANKGITVDTWTQNFSSVDRAIVDRTEGFVRIHTRRGTGVIVGATIVAPNAGDLISELTLAINHRIKLGQIASTIHPYPTLADAIRKIGDQYNRTRLTSFNKWILKMLLKKN